MATKAQVDAKKNKNDEFYTRYEDVEAELSKYMEQFNDKVIYCPCDEFQFNSLNGEDGETTAFISFFINKCNNHIIKIKKLITTAYNKEAPATYYTWTPEMNALEEHKFITSNGDFRSDECIELLKESDIVVTNPPFSLFREFVDVIMKYNKKFLIIGNNNAITYREFFPLIKENKVWKGYTVPKEFIIPNDFESKDANYINKHGQKIAKLGMTCWFTNLDTTIRHRFLYTKALYNSLSGKVEDYQKYENYDAINVDKVLHIPMDYEGVIGVPITFIDRYCPDQFEIIGLGISNSGLEVGVKPYTVEHKNYRKQVQKRGAVDGDLYMLDEFGHPEVPYARILIRKKSLQNDNRGY